MKRTWWLLVSLTVPLALLAAWLPELRAAGSPAFEKTAVTLPLHDLIINEWSQGGSGSQEWVELLVVAGPADVRSWDLGDSVPGDLTLSSDSLWASLPTGTRLVIYNGSDRDPLLPADDDDPTDCQLVLPHNNGRYFSGAWPALANATSADNPHLRDAAGSTIHDFSAEPGSGLHPGAGENAQFMGADAAGVGSVAEWQNQSASVATPGTGNSPANVAWLQSLCQPGNNEAPDLAVAKSGPASATAGATLVYTLRLENKGQQPATAVWLTDTLPASLTYVADSSGLPYQQPNPQTLVWQVGQMLPGSPPLTFALTATLSSDVTGSVTNVVTVQGQEVELSLANNRAEAVTVIDSGVMVLLDAVLYDGYETGDADEAVALRHVAPTAARPTAVDLSGWSINDGGSATAVLPTGALLAPGEVLWLAKDGAAFTRQFGFAPHFERTDTSPTIPNLAGSWPGFANSGDEVVLLDESGRLIDVLVYSAGNVNQAGWQGAALQPYTVSHIFAVEGQILYRRRSQATGLVVADTDTAVDWAQDRADAVNGRKVLYPGWDLDSYWQTAQITETAVLTLAIAPDHAYETLATEIRSARQSLQIEALTFENLALADDLLAAVARGVAVTVLLEGSPVGGLPDAEMYICRQLEAAGGQCWFMVSDDTQNIFDRYRFLHAKFMLVDGQRAVISSENLSPNSLPDDDKRDGTWGRRGVLVVTDAPGVVAHLQALFAADLDPAHHVDLFRWHIDHPVYGAPPVNYVPVTQTGGITYPVEFPAPLVLHGNFAFEIVQSPENSLRDVDGLLGLVNQAGAGDTVLVQQLGERPFWGAKTSTAQTDPNPRLEAYIAAARRGAQVRLLLDSFFEDPEDPTRNAVTCRYVQDIARRERLDLDCTLANPTGLGIHNKMVLVQAGGTGTIHVGSLNGTEQASKGNRELALQVQSNEAFAWLAQMFWHDWPYRRFLPLLVHNLRSRANHVLISELLYDPPGRDEAEFVELVNPMALPIDLSGYSLGDAVLPTDFEDLRHFPAGTVLDVGATLVVATSATAFEAAFGYSPDFEVVETSTAVANLIDDPTWGDPAALFQMGNAGDEVFLRAPDYRVVDVVTYGSGSFAATLPCGLVQTSGHSLERYPYWRDTDDCAADFRDWPFPNPGSLP